MVGGSGLDSTELVAGRPRLPGQSRLKTAPTIYNSAINLGSFFYDLTGRSRPAAAPIWNNNQFFMYILYNEYIDVSVVNLQKPNEIGKKLHFMAA